MQFAFDLEAYVQLPDKVRINATGDIENKQFFYDGKTFTLYGGAEVADSAKIATARASQADMVRSTFAL